MFHIPGTDQVSVLWSPSFSCSRVCFFYFTHIPLYFHFIDDMFDSLLCRVLYLFLVFSSTDPEVCSRFYKWQNTIPTRGIAETYTRRRHGLST
ncbi:hypothetical protein CROQUDRAFT_657850 [Cronartium quercuum f. sp. fusiforme G11]|uniref:Uncharacterized protein n=1 Tax=Cronartium quercuum f. sp. fusiforme G11 TaxID=708437 RepID=A0A9P6NL70_9BASI|nr:hypothetical protein CROQUDRAFT_657850 [Cronartium quercuum f. sp. fusiforme G11]